MDVPPDQLQAESLEACLPILRGLDEVPKIDHRQFPGIIFLGKRWEYITSIYWKPWIYIYIQYI
jgi:hypothetical protein